LGGDQERPELEIVILSPLFIREPVFASVPSLVPAAWEVPMGEALTIVIAFVVAAGVLFYVTGRVWQRRHTYIDEFWHSNGW
jgi:hypothetical protein